MTKRVNSLQNLCTALREEGIQFPCSEGQFYNFVKQESLRGAPASRLKSFFEALVFTRHVLGLEKLQGLIDSRRCVGATMSKGLTDMSKTSLSFYCETVTDVAFNFARTWRAMEPDFRWHGALLHLCSGEMVRRSACRGPFGRQGQRWNSAVFRD